MTDGALDRSGTPIPYLRVASRIGKHIQITHSYWQRIVTIKHPSIAGKEKEAKKTLEDPSIIRQSRTDSHVFLYYRKQKSCYLCVVARHLNGQGFVITVYITDKIKEGKLIWQKENKK